MLGVLSSAITSASATIATAAVPVAAPWTSQHRAAVSHATAAVASAVRGFAVLAATADAAAVAAKGTRRWPSQLTHKLDVPAAPVLVVNVIERIGLPCAISAVASFPAASVRDNECSASSCFSLHLKNS